MYATLRTKVLENTQWPLPLNPEDAQSGGNALCKAHSDGFRGLYPVQSAVVWITWIFVILDAS